MHLVQAVKRRAIYPGNDSELSLAARYVSIMRRENRTTDVDNNYRPMVDFRLIQKLQNSVFERGLTNAHSHIMLACCSYVDEFIVRKTVRFTYIDRSIT